MVNVRWFSSVVTALGLVVAFALLGALATIAVWVLLSLPTAEPLAIESLGFAAMSAGALGPVLVLLSVRRATRTTAMPMKRRVMSDDAYRWAARWYDMLFEPMNSGLRSIGLKILPPREGMLVLDVGCGTGVQLGLYQRRGCTVCGIDPSPAMLQVARKRLGDKAELYLGDASEMPFRSGSFDLAMCCLVLHEMSNSTRSSVVEEMKRVLTKDGRILVIDYHSGPARPLKGWVTKAVILLSEVAAGRQHFRHYREFMALRGLPHLASQHRLRVDTQRIVSGGNLGVFLLANSRAT